ncbi:MAG: TonB family protein, partial [Pyrinomonadaceae bacterium]|nr:TonB family protein [Pyrinomonadaceae bacterium]
GQTAAQTIGETPNVATTKWETRASQSKGFSVSLPKTPSLYAENNYKVSESTVRYASYADGVIYVVSVTNAVPFDENPYNRKMFPLSKPFDDSNFTRRVEDLKRDLPNAKFENIENKNAVSFLQITNDKKTYRFYNDSANKRWFEVWKIGDDEATIAQTKKFFDSFKIIAKPLGAEIGDGAPYLLGDIKEAEPVEAALKSNKPQQPQTEKSVTTPLTLVIKPSPNYTETARKNIVEGAVRLKVNFSANGTVSILSVVYGLPDGLTEQAMEAAKRIVFIPQSKNGERVSVTKMIEYGFKMY